MNLYSIIPIIAIIFVAQIIAYKTEGKLTDTLPVTCCGFILVLYILGFVRVLSWIDYVSIPVVILLLFWLLFNEELKVCFQNFITVQNLMIPVFVGFIAWCMFNRAPSAIDDIGYWSTDLKQIWAVNGFAKGFGNVASEFGDYPPAINLFRWFFVHIYFTDYQEGMGFAGYICMNYILMLPIIGRVNELVERKIVFKKEKKSSISVATNSNYVVSDRRLISKYKVRFIDGNGDQTEAFDFFRCIFLIVINILAGFVLLLIPTIANSSCMEGTNAEITTGIIYGLLLWAIWDEKPEHGKYYYIRIGLYASVLVLCKNTGFIWALFATLFLMGCYFIRKNNQSYDSSMYDNSQKYNLITIGSWVAVFLSWVIFCVANKRVSRLTSLGMKMFKEGNLDLKHKAKEMIGAYIQGFSIFPMHNQSSGILNLTPLIMLAIFIFVVFIFARIDLIDKEQRLYLIGYILVTAFLSYLIIFIGHQTVYMIDSPMFNSQVMGESIALRGAPYIVGTFILICGIWLNNIPEADDARPTTEFAVKEHVQAERLKLLRIFYGGLALFVFLTSDLWSVYNGLYDYRFDSDKGQTLREESYTFIDTVSSNREFAGKRILYLCSSQEDEANRARISYAVSPVSVVYGTVDNTVTKYGALIDIDNSDAAYIYADSNEHINDIFDMICSDGYQQSGLYRIKDDGKIEAYHVTVEYDVDTTIVK